jgi:uncharacterized membrane protein HdeD (DUF308 family)
LSHHGKGERSQKPAANGACLDTGGSLKRSDDGRNLKASLVGPRIRGIAAIVFGVIAFTHPVMAIATLVLFFGAWVLIDGIFRIFGAIKHRGSDSDWAWQLVIGLIGIIVGLLTFHAPQVTALALVIYIAAWALMIGASEIVMAVKLRHEIKGEWLLILMGLASIVFAVLLLWNPVAGAAAVIWLIAWYAVVLGILAIFFGFRLKTLRPL